MTTSVKPNINTLPAINMDSAVALVNTILTSYTAACAAVASFLPNQAAKNNQKRLFWGSRVGSKVINVRDQSSVEQMFRRAIMNGRVPGSITHYPNGDQVFCFKLTNHYFNKGRTTYVRLSDLMDEGSVFLNAVGFGKRYDPSKDIDYLEIQAPKVDSLKCDIITIVLAPDNTFIEWYCGEPEVFYTDPARLVTKDGQLNWGAVWVQLGVDYDVQSRELRRRFAQERQNRRDHPSKENQHTPKPLSSVGAAMEVAIIAQAQENQPENQPEETTAPAVS